jgi:hypothetical protein
MARSLDIPRDINVCIMSDSTLCLFRSPTGKAQGFKAAETSVIPAFQEAHPHYVVTHNVWNGASIANIYSALPRDQETIDSFDATIIVCAT